MEFGQIILSQYGQVVWQTAYRLLGNEADAADCFQATFVNAMELAKRQAVASWPALLQRLATARALDQLRRRIRERGRFAQAGAEQMPSAAPTPLEAAMAGELREQLREALTQLSPQQAQVFCLRHLNDLSYGEIAGELGMTADAVGVNLHRARIRLQELLYHQADTLGR